MGDIVDMKTQNQKREVAMEKKWTDWKYSEDSMKPGTYVIYGSGPIIYGIRSESIAKYICQLQNQDNANNHLVITYPYECE